MSRILRRPMFRGGRVDSRGTGITSGLGYAKGGSVNTPKRGLVDEPGRYSQDLRGIFVNKPSVSKPPVEPGRFARAANWIKGVPSWMKASPVAGWGARLAGYGGIGYGLGQLTDWVTRAYDTPEAYAYRKKAQRENPWMNMETDLVIDDEGNMTTQGAIVQDEINRLDVGEKPGLFPRGGIKKWMTDRGLEKEYNISTGEKIVKEIANKDEDELTPEQKKYKDLVEKYESLQSTLNELLKPKNSTEEEDLAEIEKTKKMMEKVYGSGRGEDATNMLLSFAGKALKPGADTKSAFGEFFEDESKRPSERKKYKDAAATAAINAYLAGKKTLAETEAFMNKTNWQLNQQAALKKAANDPSNLDWTDRRTYYMTSIKGNNRDSGKVIRMSLQDEESEKGKQIFETKDTEWITNPTEAAEMDDGLYIVTPKKGPKRIFEIKEGIVIDRSSDFPL